MSRNDAVMASYQKGYDEARAFYDNDELDEAVRLAESMLDDGDLPRYHRIKCYLLVAACVEDFIEAEDLLERANSQWGLARSCVPRTAEDADSEAALAELRIEIDSVKQQLTQQRAAAWAEQERRWEQEMEDEEGEEEEESVEGEPIEEDERVEKSEKVVPGDVVIKDHDRLQVPHDQQKQEDADELKIIPSTGIEPLHHYRHKPGSVRLKKQASRASIIPSSSSPATFMPFRNPMVVPKVKKEDSPPQKDQ